MDERADDSDTLYVQSEGLAKAVKEATEKEKNLSEEEQEDLEDAVKENENEVDNLFQDDTKPRDATEAEGIRHSKAHFNPEFQRRQRVQVYRAARRWAEESSPYDAKGKLRWTDELDENNEIVQVMCWFFIVCFLVLLLWIEFYVLDEYSISARRGLARSNRSNRSL